MKVKIRKDLAFRRIAGELFVVDSVRDHLHELNGSAALIWEGLAAGKNEELIAADLAGEFEVGEGEARKDLAAFVAELLEAGLLVKSV
jgi:hypothetical protein